MYVDWTTNVRASSFERTCIELERTCIDSLNNEHQLPRMGARFSKPRALHGLADAFAWMRFYKHCVEPVKLKY